MDSKYVEDNFRMATSALKFLGHSTDTQIPMCILQQKLNLSAVPKSQVIGKCSIYHSNCPQLNHLKGKTKALTYDCQIVFPAYFIEVNQSRAQTNSPTWNDVKIRKDRFSSENFQREGSSQYQSKMMGKFCFCQYPAKMQCSKKGTFPFYGDFA